ncbi:hypothetical protein Q4562_02300 [Zobellia uliginosa]|nr:hypothetical protein [Zobellia uliginosa]MDO6516041.1 hypothetical protein [Zobellia uliginosa]
MLTTVIFESVLVNSLYSKTDVVSKPEVYTNTTVNGTSTNFVNPGITSTYFNEWIYNFFLKEVIFNCTI